jgi:hypothetical protein
VTENQRYLQELLRLIREDIGTPEILAQLHNLLARDRAVLQDYIREMHLQASLNWLLDGQVHGGPRRSAPPALGAPALLGLAGCRFARRSLSAGDTGLCGSVALDGRRRGRCPCGRTDQSGQDSGLGRRGAGG